MGSLRRVSVLGVPTSAGSHNPGQEKAPTAWRAAGLIDALRTAGLDVEDRGDLPAAPYRPVEPADGLRDADRVAEVARRVAAEVAAIRGAGRLPLVLGGDCTITLGALVGFDPAELDTGEWTELTSRHLYAAPAPRCGRTRRAKPGGLAPT